MRILVDADACPVKEIILREAKRRNIPVIMVTDTSHELDDGYSTVLTVDKGSDSADYAIVGMAARDDIVVTQDYGLAAMVLAKGASALDQNGMIYTNDNISSLLERRYIGQKIRRGGGRTKGPKKRNSDDDGRFEASLCKMLDRGKAGQQRLRSSFRMGRRAMDFICYPKCTTCQKARKWLDERGVPYKIRDIKEEKPSYDELKTWFAASGLPVRKFFNTSGLLYKSLNLKDRLPAMSEEECLQLLSTDGMLVKRPLLIDNGVPLVGFKEADWAKVLGSNDEHEQLH